MDRKILYFIVTVLNTSQHAVNFLALKSRKPDLEKNYSCPILVYLFQNMTNNK